MTIPPVFLELFVLALGIVILVLESFAEKQDRKVFALYRNRRIGHRVLVSPAKLPLAKAACSLTRSIGRLFSSKKSPS